MTKSTKIVLRAAASHELTDLNALCLRSKAYWGYDPAFMAACVPVLTLTDADLHGDLLCVAERDGSVAGLAQLSFDPDTAEIDRLFVDPDAMGAGVGRALFAWCVDTARVREERKLRIEADPGAVPFYERMGARVVGQAPSDAVAGRMLPVLEYRVG